MAAVHGAPVLRLPDGWLLCLFDLFDGDAGFSFGNGFICLGPPGGIGKFDMAFSRRIDSCGYHLFITAVGHNRIQLIIFCITD